MAGFCKSCGKRLKFKDFHFTKVPLFKNFCLKCERAREKDRDRTGRSSKKDKHKDKELRDSLY